MNDYLDLAALWKVLLAALAGGAGLAAVFSLALAGLATGRPTGRAGAVVCFLAVAAGVIIGLRVMLDK